MKRLLVLSCLLLLATSARAGVIFETNFDSHADWSPPSTGMECSPLPGGNNSSGVSNTANACSAGAYPAGWEGFRNGEYTGQVHKAVNIGAPPAGADHTGSGKVALFWQKPTGDSGTYNSDGILVKWFGNTANYPELYIRFWFKVQSGWVYADTGNIQHKIFRILHWRSNNDSLSNRAACSYDANIFQWADDSSGVHFLDFGKTSGTPKFYDAFRCEATPRTGNCRSADYYCDSQGLPTWNHEDYNYAYSGGVNPVDGNWHKIDLHYKMNTMGQTDGIYTLSIDDVVQQDRSTVMWQTSSAVSGMGWNAVAFGGNANNSGSEQWYAIDDITISTTAINSTTNTASKIGGGTVAGTVQ